MEKRLAVVGIAFEDRTIAANVNEILSGYGEMIVGRMGIPYREVGVHIISLIVNGTNDEIGALTGKLGNTKGVKAKVALMH